MRWTLVGLIVVFNATGDLLNTAGMKRHGEVEDFGAGAMKKLLLALARNAFVVGGVIAMAVSFFCLLSLLSIAPLSFAVPATASSYILETFLAQYLLGEHVSWQRWFGACVVAAGVVMLAL